MSVRPERPTPRARDRYQHRRRVLRLRQLHGLALVVARFDHLAQAIATHTRHMAELIDALQVPDELMRRRF